jgi:hypothetical protein
LLALRAPQCRMSLHCFVLAPTPNCIMHQLMPEFVMSGGWLYLCRWRTSLASLARSGMHQVSPRLCCIRDVNHPLHAQLSFLQEGFVSLHRPCTSACFI